MPLDDPDKILPIHNSAHGNDSYTFPAHGRIFGPERADPIYLTGREHEGHEVVALKYAFYILAGDKEPLKEEYPLLDKLRAETNRDPVEQGKRLRLGLDQMFRHIILKAHETIAVGRYRYRIGKVCLTIPSLSKVDEHSKDITPSQ